MSASLKKVRNLHLRLWQYRPLYPGGHLQRFRCIFEQIPPFRHFRLHLDTSVLDVSR